MNALDFIRKNKAVLAIALAFSMFSCSTISYVPQVHLDLSPKTVYKSLQIEKFVDNSPKKDTENPFLGLSVTNEKALASDLSVAVTNAVVSDFSNNSVFEQVGRRVQNPDYLLKGEINTYKGVSKLTTYGYISLFTIYGVLTWYLGIPIQKIESKVELTVTLHDGSGNLIGTYKGEDIGFQRKSMYNNIALATPSQTDKNFSLAIESIRNQILEDIAE